MIIAVAVAAFVAGCVITGEVAHRKPEWFAEVVKIANKAVDAAKKV